MTLEGGEEGGTEEKVLKIVKLERNGGDEKSMGKHIFFAI